MERLRRAQDGKGAGRGAQPRGEGGEGLAGRQALGQRLVDRRFRRLGAGGAGQAERAGDPLARGVGIGPGDEVQAFDEKLRRARRKEQYLRIQACTLARSHPEVALKLLDRYFELQDDFDHAQAHVDRATALLALGRVGEALAAYEGSPQKTEKIVR